MRDDWRQVVVQFLGQSQEELNRLRVYLERPGADDWEAIECVIHNLGDRCWGVIEDVNREPIK